MQTHFLNMNQQADDSVNHPVIDGDSTYLHSQRKSTAHDEPPDLQLEDVNSENSPVNTWNHSNIDQSSWKGFISELFDGALT